jgi:hypothetical protein
MREELAHRLGEILAQAIDNAKPEPDGGALIGLGRLTDECIRQMEWARKRWQANKDSNGSTFYTAVPEGHPMTLAPPDWKP